MSDSLCLWKYFYVMVFSKDSGQNVAAFSLEGDVPVLSAHQSPIKQNKTSNDQACGILFSYFQGNMPI